MHNNESEKHVGLCLVGIFFTQHLLFYSTVCVLFVFTKMIYINDLGKYIIE